MKDKLLALQSELKSPKSLFNKFGNYSYRSAETILESVKPLLKKYNLLLTISDEITLIGERYYVKSTVKLNDIGTDQFIEVTAFAREEENKKGQDGSQITGSTSSYARKYALNGMFAIDDTKDSDDTNTHGKEEEPKQKAEPSQTVKLATAEQVLHLGVTLNETEKAKVYEHYKIAKLEDLTEEQARALMARKAKK